MNGEDSGMRPNKLCPACKKPVFYSGHVDVTASGDENRTRKRGGYVCQTEVCEEFQQVVQPIDR